SVRICLPATASGGSSIAPEAPSAVNSTVAPRVTSRASPAARSTTSLENVITSLVLPAANARFQTRVSKSAPVMVSLGALLKLPGTTDTPAPLGTRTLAVTGTPTTFENSNTASPAEVEV